MSDPTNRARTLAELSTRVVALRDAWEAGDGEQLARLAHATRGAAVVVEVDDLAVALVALEAGLAAGDDVGVGRALVAAEHAVVAAGVEERLRRLRHDLRNDLGKMMMAAGLLELELVGDQVERARQIVAAAGEASKKVDAITLRPEAPPIPPARTPETYARIDGLRVLVVDDDEIAGSSLAGMLRAAGGVVVLAARLADALAELATTRFDAALVDLSLGEQSGADLLPVLRRTGIRAVAFTGDADSATESWDAVVPKGAPSASIVSALTA